MKQSTIALGVAALIGSAAVAQNNAPQPAPPSSQAPAGPETNAPDPAPPPGEARDPQRPLPAPQPTPTPTPDATDPNAPSEPVLEQDKEPAPPARESEKPDPTRA